jgi:hypothetical protein
MVFLVQGTEKERMSFFGILEKKYHASESAFSNKK